MATATQEAPVTAPINWVDEAHEYLISKGWKRAGLDARNLPTYEDPHGSNEPTMDIATVMENGRQVERWVPRKTTEVKVKAKGGGEETIKQVVGPPCPWVYSVEEATANQRQRDKYTADTERQAKEDAAKREQELAAKRAQPSKKAS